MCPRRLWVMTYFWVTVTTLKQDVLWQCFRCELLLQFCHNYKRLVYNLRVYRICPVLSEKWRRQICFYVNSGGNQPRCFPGKNDTNTSIAHIMIFMSVDLWNQSLFPLCQNSVSLSSKPLILPLSLTLYEEHLFAVKIYIKKQPWEVEMSI